MALEDIQTEEVVQEQDEQKDINRKEISDDECVDEINNSDNPLETALQMIRRWDTYCVIRNIPKFEKNLDHDMERQIIIYAIKKWRQPWSVLDNWENYKLLTKMDKQLIADTFVECDDLHVLEDMLSNNEISNMDRQSRKIFEQVLKDHQESLDSMLLNAWSDETENKVDSQETIQNKTEQKNNEEYGSFDEASCMEIMNNAKTPLEWALKLMDREDTTYYAIRNISKFEKKMNHEMEKKIVIYAIKKWRQPGSVLTHWENFKLLTKKDKEEIAKTFIECGDAHVIDYMLSNDEIPDLDWESRKIFEKTLEWNKEENWLLDGFEYEMSDEDICMEVMDRANNPIEWALKLIGEWNTSFVLRNISEFEKNMNHEMEKQIVISAIKEWRQPGTVLRYWGNYKLLTRKDKEEIVNIFIECWDVHVVEYMLYKNRISNLDTESRKIFERVLESNSER